MKIEKELKGLTKSFTFAFRGIRNCILSERNMRIHIVITVFMFLLSLFYNFSRTEYILLLLTISSVIACEMLNTAVEAFVDLAAPSYNKLAQITKDIAAGAVLVSAIIAVAIGIILFWDIDKFAEIISFFNCNPLLLIALLIAAIAGLIFIFKGTNIANKNKFKGKK